MLDFETESIQILHQFQIEDSESCSGIYLFNSMRGKILEFSSKESFLQQNYIVCQTFPRYEELKIRKLSEPAKVLYELKNQRINSYKKLRVFRIEKDDLGASPDQENTILLLATELG